MQSFYAGCYIGFGAQLATAISANLPGWTSENPGFESFVFAALFPVNLLLILLSGGILFTGTSAACPAAIYEGKASIKDTARCLALSWKALPWQQPSRSQRRRSARVLAQPF